MRNIALLLHLVLILTLSACAQNPVRKLYEGEERSASEIAVVRVPIELEIMRINGERIEGLNTLFSPQHKDLHLRPGEYRILAYYKDLWELSGDGHDVVKTDPALFVVNAKAGNRYKLGFEEPQNLEEARALENKFSGHVLNTDTGQKTPTQASGLAFKSGIAGGLGEMAGMEPVAETGETENQSAASTVAPMAKPASDTDTENAAGSAEDSPHGSMEPTPEQDYLNMLKVYWSEATTEERRDFLKWISENEGARVEGRGTRNEEQGPKQNE